MLLKTLQKFVDGGGLFFVVGSLASGKVSDGEGTVPVDGGREATILAPGGQRTCTRRVHGGRVEGDLTNPHGALFGIPCQMLPFDQSLGYKLGIHFARFHNRCGVEKGVVGAIGKIETFDLVTTGRRIRPRNIAEGKKETWWLE